MGPSLPLLGSWAYSQPLPISTVGLGANTEQQPRGLIIQTLNCLTSAARRESSTNVSYG